MAVVPNGPTVAIEGSGQIGGAHLSDADSFDPHDDPFFWIGAAHQ
jgi:hypothetical protein